jgi:RNA polymerase sigma-70 factor (ECF subfamily)
MQAMAKSAHQIADELLVLRCQEGDRAAFERLVSRWQDRLWRHAWRMTGREEAASDAVQETWVAIVRHIRRLEDPAAFPSWAYRICTSRCVDWVRREQRRRGAAQQMAHDALPEPPRQASSADSHDAVRRAVARLTQHHRAVVSLHYGEGLGLAEIAAVLGIPEGTVKSRLHNAREKLRAELEGGSHE